MLVLGYPTYVAQGGDWGSLVARRLGQLYPSHCRAIHVNMLFTLGTPRLMQGPLIWLKWVTLIGPILLYDKREIPALQMFQKFRELETGYQVHMPSFLRWSAGSEGRLFKDQSRRVWLMDCGIRQWDYWLGFVRSWILGQIIIHGQTTNL